MVDNVADAQITFTEGRAVLLPINALMQNPLIMFSGQGSRYTLTVGGNRFQVTYVLCVDNGAYVVAVPEAATELVRLLTEVLGPLEFVNVIPSLVHGYIQVWG